MEEELVVIDLQTPGWPTIPAPYLAPLHSSAITCSYHISNVPLKLWERIVSVGEQQSPRLSSAVSAGDRGDAHTPPTPTPSAIGWAHGAVTLAVTPPPRLGPSTGGRTWPRSPRSEVCSSPGERLPWLCCGAPRMTRRGHGGGFLSCQEEGDVPSPFPWWDWGWVMLGGNPPGAEAHGGAGEPGGGSCWCWQG